MKTLRKHRSTAAIALAFAAGLLAAPLLTPLPLRAQDSTPAASANDKLELWTQALQARDDHDLAKARDLFLKLQAIDPNDPYVKRNLADIEADIASQGSVPAASATPAAPSETTAAPGPAPASEVVPVRQLPSNADISSAANAGAAPAGNGAWSLPVITASPTVVAKQASSTVQAEAAKTKAQITATGAIIKKAESLIKSGDYDGARTLLAQAQAQLPPGIGYNQIQDQIKQDIADSYYQQALVAYNKNQIDDATANLKQYTAVAGDTKQGERLQSAIDASKMNPTRQDITAISPGFTELQDKINQLLVKGRAQYLYGDYAGAQQTFDEVIINDPSNVEAEAYINRITQNFLATSSLDHTSTRNSMLLDVDREWKRPDVYTRTEGLANNSTGENPIQTKLDEIIFPRISFVSGTALDQVIKQLSDSSADYDKEGKGVNMQVVPNADNPVIPKLPTDFNLNNVNLTTILNSLGKQTGYSYQIEESVVTMRPGVTQGETETQVFPISQGTITLIVGYHGDTGGGGGGGTDPFASSTPAAGAAAPAATADTSGGGDVEAGLKNFFVQAGALNDDAKVAYADGKIYVTTKPEYLEKLAILLRKYNEVKQVEIESKFLDVSEGALKELGMNWGLSNPNYPNLSIGTNNRGLSTAFPLGNSGAQPTTVIQPPPSIVETVNNTTITIPEGNSSTSTYPQEIPTLPDAINVGSGIMDNFSGVIGIVEGFRLNAVIDALDQEQGSDLMSAPKVTVLSNHQATITIAQVLRYPTTFGTIQSQVSPASGGAGSTASGSAGVTITAGTPQDFAQEQIGVVMDVTPTVEDDDSISLQLDPKVTEFEGFIEYGGVSLAIQSGTTAVVPSGFIQPVFDVREVRTAVTIFDGATVVMGGLTQDQILSVNDKVPVLGDVPLIGRLFQTKGSTTQKRNLMIFVTANLISPGGSPAKQQIMNVVPGSLFENPTFITPNRSVNRTPVEAPAPAAAQ